MTRNCKCRFKSGIGMTFIHVEKRISHYGGRLRVLIGQISVWILGIGYHFPCQHQTWASVAKLGRGFLSV